jgi:hypothetical protein
MGKKPPQHTPTLALMKKHLGERAFHEAAVEAWDLAMAQDDKDPAKHWVAFVPKLAQHYGVKLPPAASQNIDDLTKFLTDLSIQLNLAETILFDRESSDVVLDDDWRAKASTYVSHIRSLVMKAELEEGLRERITSRLNDLQRELDRNRTKVASVAEVFLSLTEAVQKGAKNLVPAVRLFERLAGALSGARTASREARKTLRLPPPEAPGLCRA